LYTAPN